MNKRILCCAAALMLAAGGINALPPAVTDITVSAYKKGDFTIDDKYVKKYNGFTYVVWNDDYQGDPDLYDDPDFSVGKGVVEILDYKVSGDSIEFPDKIKGLPVGFIDPNPLWNSKVKKIKLPKSIYFFYDHQNSEGGVYEYGRMAPYRALAYVPELEWIDINSGAYSASNGLLYIKNIDGFKKTLYCVPHKAANVKIKSDVDSIGMMAFYGNAAVTSLTIPSTVKYIGAGAFCEMSALKSVKINAPLERLEDGTFFNCPKLRTVTLPDTLTTIGSDCFDQCVSLESITIPDKTEWISSFAFSGCSSLSEVNMNSRMKHIGIYAFGECSKLKELTLPETIEELDADCLPCYFDETTEEYKVYKGFKLRCYPGVAEDYAKAYGIRYELLAKSMYDAKIKLSSKETPVYTGKAIKPAFKVVYDGKVLKKGTDYKASYKSNTNPGKGYVIVNGIGEYGGRIKKGFKIKPAAPKTLSLTTPSKSAVKLKWKPDKLSDGYQILLSTDKSFKKNLKKVYIKKNSTSAKVIKGLKSGKRCYVKIRAYKSVGKTKTKIYSDFSKTRSIVCK